LRVAHGHPEPERRVQLEVEGLRGGRDACRGNGIGRQGQDVLHAVPAARTIRVEEKRRLIVADVRREGLEIVDLGAEVAADAAFDMRMDLPGRDRCAGEKTDEQGSNRREGEARTEMSHEVPPTGIRDARDRRPALAYARTRPSVHTRRRLLRRTTGPRRSRDFAALTLGWQDRLSLTAAPMSGGRRGVCILRA